MNLKSDTASGSPLGSQEFLIPKIVCKTPIKRYLPTRNHLDIDKAVVLKEIQARKVEFRFGDAQEEDEALETARCRDGFTLRKEVAVRRRLNFSAQPEADSETYCCK